MEGLEKQMAEMGIGESTMQMIVDYSLKVLGVLVVVYLSFLIAGKMRDFTERRLTKINFDKSLSKFAANAVRWGVIFLGMVACLSIFGVETTSFAAVIGGASVAIGLALQGSLSHLASGVMLLVFRPFGVGDYIEVAGKSGTVDEISLFTVTLDTPDNRRIIIPNNSIFGSVIENFSFHAIRRVDVAVGVGYGENMDETRRVLEEAAKTVKNVILDDPDHAPFAYLVELGDSALSWQIRVFCKGVDYWGVREELTVATKKHLDAAKLDIPFPQLVTHRAA